MKNKIPGIVFISFVIMILICTFVNFSSKEPPSPDIEIGGTPVAYTINKVQWEGEDIDEADPFSQILGSLKRSDLPYFKIGETVNVHFEQEMPDRIEIQDYILDDTGRMKYSDDIQQKLITDTRKKLATFEIDENRAVFFSVYNDDGLPGKVIRGFRIVCLWNRYGSDNVCEYAFVIRTDISE